MKGIAILGSGPSGLLAAYAASFTDSPVTVISIGGKSRIGGAQFLHRSIPGVTDDDPDTVLTYRVEGSAGGYQAKAYPPDTVPPFVSFDDVHDGLTVPAWNLRGIYTKLWDLSHEHINEMRVQARDLEELLGSFELVISTIPKPALCCQPLQHHFKRQRIKILNTCILNNPEENTIYYDGTGDHSWYRASYLFGTGSTEWSATAKLPYGDLVTVAKPISTNCDCWSIASDNLLFAGRFGKWTKGVLTHHAFEDAIAKLGVLGLLNEDKMSWPMK